MFETSKYVSRLVVKTATKLFVYKIINALWDEVTPHFRLVKGV